ncbi:hypothetical protein B0H13DRAFT_1956493 [Mycena leptocephala]|nr:hypothetical protein B0H13DRAFT_1956493 [Mycena leptocephala]
MLRYLNLGINSHAVGTEAVVFEAPLLRTVILNNEAALQVILPWAQLTSLTLFCVYPHECVPVLQQTSNLVRCKLHICFNPDNDQPGPDLTLPYLESLTLIDMNGNPGTGFKLKLSLSLLSASLKQFISKSGCKLEELRIAGQRARPQHSYRKVFPWIRNFFFDCERADERDPSDVEASS